MEGVGGCSFVLLVCCAVCVVCSAVCLMCRDAWTEMFVAVCMLICDGSQLSQWKGREAHGYRMAGPGTLPCIRHSQA